MINNLARQLFTKNLFNPYLSSQKYDVERRILSLNMLMLSLEPRFHGRKLVIN
jgi:hypothetical protein